jgi:hypothetical protein
MTPQEVQCYIMGGLADPNEVAALGQPFEDYEANLVEQLTARAKEEVLGDAPDDDPLKAVDWYYYDRALILYRQGSRTQDQAMIDRAHAAVTKYRNVRDGQWDYPMNWSFPRGMAMHYSLTGNTKTLAALKRMTQSCYGPYYMNWLAGEPPSGDNMEGTDNRIQAYVLTHYVVMHGLGIFDIENPWEDRRTTTEMAKVALDKILASQVNGNFAAKTFQKSPFMTGLLLEALVLYWNLVEQDERIPEAVDSSLTFMWDNYRHPAGDTFKYDPGNYQIPPSEGAMPTYDLNLLTCPTMGWLDDDEWAENGDLIFSTGVASEGHLGDGKHFNQQYMLGMEYGDWRLASGDIDITEPPPEEGFDFAVGDSVRATGETRFEGQITALFETLDGDSSAVVEAVDLKFEGSQRIFRVEKLEKTSPA